MGFLGADEPRVAHSKHLGPQALEAKRDGRVALGRMGHLLLLPPALGVAISHGVSRRARLRPCGRFVGCHTGRWAEASSRGGFLEMASGPSARSLRAIASVCALVVLQLLAGCADKGEATVFPPEDCPTDFEASGNHTILAVEVFNKRESTFHGTMHISLQNDNKSLEQTIALAVPSGERVTLYENMTLEIRGDLHLRVQADDGDSARAVWRDFVPGCSIEIKSAKIREDGIRFSERQEALPHPPSQS